ncbi:MAG TPA: thioredoxin domain-containing protein [Patescibacteria group bacterium]|nr:thioredoxin domain-containing protein [Patescibacteria group bacterium]
MSNRLADETSPYLLQHADNPVDWFPWGDEALTLAKYQNKPILLSVGYAACHWCHVMAHESFEDPAIAEIMNEHFVNIKVDREERPDIDSIYMDAVVAMNGQGGWPMTVVMTPLGRPFFGGTYYPPIARHGLPSFTQVLVSLAQAWQERQSDVEDSATRVLQHIGQDLFKSGASNRLSPDLLDRAVSSITERYDHRMGGFGQAPKFPPSMTIEFLLRRYVGANDNEALAMAAHTLEMMVRGGMYDQIGGGFARYSTDNDWLVPHFEKMLYDNALLSRAYLHAWQITGKPLYRRIVEETLDWVLTEMSHPEGGFYSSLDADSQGEEGKFYVWDINEIDALLDEDAGIFKEYFGVTDLGNWDQTNILHIAGTIESVARNRQLLPEAVREKIDRSRQLLYNVRAKRPWPGLDDKVITSWNGLMMASFAEAGRELSMPRFTDAARLNADFIYHTLRSSDGRLYRTWKSGAVAKNNGYLDDYAFLADALLTLYQSTFESRWLFWAVELGEMMITFFEDEADGGFFDTSSDHESLLYRPKDLQDNAIPSGSSMAVTVLIKLSLYTGNSRFWEIAEASISSLAEVITKYPVGFGQWLSAADFILSKPLEIAIIGDNSVAGTQALVDAAYNKYRPNQVVALGRGNEGIPLLEGRTTIDGQAAAYVCRNFSCDMPVTEADLLEAKLQ